jgi:hypothetical protein
METNKKVALALAALLILTACFIDISYGMSRLRKPAPVDTGMGFALLHHPEHPGRSIPRFHAKFSGLFDERYHGWARFEISTNTIKESGFAYLRQFVKDLPEGTKTCFSFYNTNPLNMDRTPEEHALIKKTIHDIYALTPVDGAQPSSVPIDFEEYKSILRAMLIEFEPDLVMIETEVWYASVRAVEGLPKPLNRLLYATLPEYISMFAAAKEVAVEVGGKTIIMPSSIAFRIPWDGDLAPGFKQFVKHAYPLLHGSMIPVSIYGHSKNDKAKYAVIRAVLDDYGLDIPIMVSEMGAVDVRVDPYDKFMGTLNMPEELAIQAKVYPARMLALKKMGFEVVFGLVLDAPGPEDIRIGPWNAWTHMVPGLLTYDAIREMVRER